MPVNAAASLRTACRGATFTGFVLLLASAHAIAAASDIPVYEGYQLVWNDEFSDDGIPSSDRWAFESGLVRNRELQWYSERNAICEDGLLKITARRERFRNPNYDSDGEDWRSTRRNIHYTSASLTTRGLAAWQYGRFEIRAKIPVVAGLWPVVWTIGSNNRWPFSGEIDILESYDGWLLANGAWASRRAGRPKWDSRSKHVSRLGGPDWAERFHVWRMDWDEDRITISVDGKELNRINVGRARNPRDTLPRYPFREPHFLFLSLAVGGTNGGDPADTTFPQVMEVDYVRVYQRTEKSTP